MIGLLDPRIGRGLVQQCVQCLVYGKRVGNPLELVDSERTHLGRVVEAGQLQPLAFLETLGLHDPEEGLSADLLGMFVYQQSS